MSFETYAIVELMGRARIAGKVSEQVVAGESKGTGYRPPSSMQPLPHEWKGV